MSDQELIGQKIGNYVLVKEVGAGGMGAVYLGEHPEIGRKVAIKLLPLHLSLQPGMADRFRAEARAVTRIDHPNVIDIYDFGQTEGGQLYYIMELLRGQELAAVIKAHAPMTPGEVLPYLEQICAALQTAHDAEVVHRDLKPENIFVLDRQPLKVKLLDFGLAKMLDPEAGNHKTATGVVMGTPLTIAPEQAAGQPDAIGPQTDLYSLGVILYWMLAGRPPFHDKTTALLLAKHISEPPPPLAEAVAGLPSVIVSLVERCLEKRPQDRPGSATSIARDFAGALDGLAPTAVPVDDSPLMQQVPAAGVMPTGPGGVTTLGGAAGELAEAELAPPRRALLPLLLAGIVALGMGAGGYFLAMSGAAPELQPAAGASSTPDVGPSADARQPDAGVDAQPPDSARPAAKQPARRGRPARLRPRPAPKPEPKPEPKPAAKPEPKPKPKPKPSRGGGSELMPYDSKPKPPKPAQPKQKGLGDVDDDF